MKALVLLFAFQAVRAQFAPSNGIGIYATPPLAGHSIVGDSNHQISSFPSQGPSRRQLELPRSNGTRPYPEGGVHDGTF